MWLFYIGKWIIIPKLDHLVITCTCKGSSINYFITNSKIVRTLSDLYVVIFNFILPVFCLAKQKLHVFSFHKNVNNRYKMYHLLLMLYEQIITFSGVNNNHQTLKTGEKMKLKMKSDKQLSKLYNNNKQLFHLICQSNL